MSARVAQRIRRTVGENALIVVVLGYAGALLLGPLAAILWGAFGAGISAFVAELTSEAALEALQLTLLLSVGATVLNTVFGIVVAWVMVRDEFPGKRLVNAMIDLPFAVSPVVAGYMLILLFGRTGWLEPAASSLGLKIVFSWPGMLIATTFVSLPFVVREVIPVLEQAGVNQENAAFTLGANAWQTFWHVTVPSIRWGLLYGISLTFARAMGEFGAILVVSAGVSRSTETATLFIFRSLDDRNQTGAFAMATVLAVISVVVLAAMEFFKKRTDSGAET